MGKASLIKNLARRKEFMPSFWGTFLAVLGLPSVFLTLLGMHFSIGLTIGLVLFAFLFSAIANRRKWKKRHLPVQSIIPREIGVTGGMRLHCPCDSRLTNEAKRLAQYWYPSETISPDKFEQLRAKNPNILVCLTGVNGDLLGYFDVLPLKESFAEFFLRGNITEWEITHEDILAAHEIRYCKYVFISGLAVWDPDSYVDQQNASILVWGLLKYLNHFYSPAKPLALASAATKEGEDLLKKFGLGVGCQAAGRMDKRNMYTGPVTREEIAMRLACLPDWSLLCSLDWSARAGSGQKKVQTHRGVTLPTNRLYDLPAPAARNTARRR